MSSALKSIRQVSEAFFQYTNVDDMIRQTLRAALEAIGAHAGSILLADAESRQLIFRYVIGEVAEKLQGTGIPWDRGIAGAVFASGNPEVISTVEQDARHFQLTDASTGFHSHDMVVVPLKRHGGTPIGVIEVINKSMGPVNREDLDMLVVISAIAAAAIEQSKAFEALRIKDVQLQQAQKMEAIGRLAGGVAHDFNNLLTVIRCYSGFIADAVAGNEPVRTQVQEVRKAADRASGLTSQLLAFSRKQVLECRLVKLDDIVSNSGSLLRRLIGEDIQVITRLQTELAWVKADPTQLDQVLINLAVNARDAMPHGGTLTIETVVTELDESFVRNHPEIIPGKYVRLSVMDTGCGMNQETLAKLFEPFFTTKDPGKGTGLGLSIVHGVVKQIGGHILVSSEPGLGTTFTIYLPCAEPETETVMPAHAMPSPSCCSETVLLVEDEGSVRTLESGILKARGYHVLTAEHGQEAVRICREYVGTIHLLVTDLIMPYMNGRELARHILLMRPTTQVLFVSGYPDETLTRTGVTRNSDSFLQKPFSSETLLGMVRSVLDKRRG